MLSKAQLPSYLCLLLKFPSAEKTPSVNQKTFLTLRCSWIVYIPGCSFFNGFKFAFQQFNLTTIFSMWKNVLDTHIALQWLPRKNWYLRSKNYSCLITVLMAAETQAFTLLKKLMRDLNRNKKKSDTQGKATHTDCHVCSSQGKTVNGKQDF